MSSSEEQGQVAKAAWVLSVATFISRISGYIRDMLVALAFGATGATDAFYVAYRIPNLLRELLAEGSISAAFVPVFTEYLTLGKIEEAKRLVKVVFSFMLGLVFLVCLCGILLAPYIVTVIAPGFLDEPGKFNLTVIMTRIMFPFLLFISLAALFMGVHNSLKSFFVPALTTFFFNLTVIACVIFLPPFFTKPLFALAIGVTLGGFIQAAVQIPYLIKQRFNPALNFNFAHEGLKRIMLLVLPTVAGFGVAQINIFVSTFFVSFLPDGSATYLYYGMRLIHFPVGMFGVAMATAVLPSLSRQAAQGKMEDFSSTFSFSLRLLFFLTIPAMAGLFAIGEPIVHILFERGRFDAADTQGTVIALIYYALGLWAFVGVRVAASAFYSMQNTKTPVKVAALSIAANIIFSMILMGPLKHGGLALANSIGSAINFTVLFIALTKKLDHIGTKNIIISLVKTSLASIIMGTAGYTILNSPLWQTKHQLLYKASLLGATIALCVVIYLFLLKLMKSEELNYMIGLIKRKKIGKKN